MSRQRYINTKFWDDNYIINLDPIEKLLFIYFLTNPLTTIAGIYEISLKRIGFDTGIDKDMVHKIIERFAKDNKIIYKEGWLFIVNFVKHQAVNPKIEIGIKETLKTVPKRLIDSLCIAYDSLGKALNYVNVNTNLNTNTNVNYNKEEEQELCDNTKFTGTLKKWCLGAKDWNGVRLFCCPDRNFKECMEWFNEYNRWFLNYIVHEKNTLSREKFMDWKNRKNKEYDKTLYPIYYNQLKEWLIREEGGVHDKIRRYHKEAVKKC